MWKIFLLLFEPAVLAAIGALLASFVNLTHIHITWIPIKWLKDIFSYFKNTVTNIEGKIPRFIKLRWIITILSAVFCVPLVYSIIVWVAALWNVSLTKFPGEIVSTGALVIIIITAYSLFLLRKKYRRIYAFIEIVVGLAMVWEALGMFSNNLIVLDSLKIADALKFFASIYVLIRGFVNWDEKDSEVK
jgi:hypothetical protein